MSNKEFVLKLMKETYGLLEASGEVSRKSVELVERMAAELDRRDAM